jgi:hypothetical protein
MGADFIYQILPLCKLTSDRKIKLVWMVEEFEDIEEIKSVCEDYFLVEDMDLPEAKEHLVYYIDEYPEFSYRRDVGWLILNGAKYMLTGGMSWGDEPTDSFRDFEYLQWAWDELEKWAKEDEQKS